MSHARSTHAVRLILLGFSAATISLIAFTPTFAVPVAGTDTAIESNTTADTHNESPPPTESPDATAKANESKPAVQRMIPDDLLAGKSIDKAQLVRLSPKNEVWIDRKSKAVILAGTICCREGPLEMFACPRGTKEHESVVAVHSQSKIVHAALLAAGLKSGTPVAFEPKYKPAEGPVVEIIAVWRDEKTKKQNRVRAQQWVRHVTTKKPMQSNWVFAGSGFWKDPKSGKEYYLADGGELICVSNFSTATLDLTVESPQDNNELFFESFTENIPPLGTPVWLVMREKK